MNNIAQPWKRLLAYFIDVTLALIFPVSLIFVFSASPDVTSVLNHLSSYLVFLILVYPIVYVIFISLLISTFGGTVGKLLTGTRIVRQGGENLSFRRAFFRNYIGYMISGLMFGLGFIWILIDKERRGWHDQIVDAYVIVRNKWIAILGVVSLAIFIFIEFMLISVSIINLKSNSAVYTTIINEIQTSLKSGNTDVSK